jgi:hypothetical protein
VPLALFIVRCDAADATYCGSHGTGDTTYRGADRAGHAANLRINIPPAAQYGE